MVYNLAVEPNNEPNPLRPTAQDQGPGTTDQGPELPGIVQAIVDKYEAIQASGQFSPTTAPPTLADALKVTAQARRDYARVPPLRFAGSAFHATVPAVGKLADAVKAEQVQADGRSVSLRFALSRQAVENIRDIQAMHYRPQASGKLSRLCRAARQAVGELPNNWLHLPGTDAPPVVAAFKSLSGVVGVDACGRLPGHSARNRLPRELFRYYPATGNQRRHALRLALVALTLDQARRTGPGDAETLDLIRDIHRALWPPSRSDSAHVVRALRQDLQPLRGTTGVYTLSPVEDYREEMGVVLWHRLPIQEPPEVGHGPGCGELLPVQALRACFRLRP